MKSATMRIQTQLHTQGSLFVAGIDEVGRGCLAGPLVAGVVVLPQGFRTRLYDSKLIPAPKRKQLSHKIITEALGYGLGWVSNTEIDEFGLVWALQEAYERALVDMNLEVSHIILDGSYNYLSEYDICETLVKADQKVACVAAASIVAKVARDEYMQALCQKYPEFCFDTNVGYGTRAHRDALKVHGLTDIHRQSFCSNLI